MECTRWNDVWTVMLLVYDESEIVKAKRYNHDLKDIFMQVHMHKG